MKKSKTVKPEGIVYVVSLGCPKNLVDTEVMTGVLISNGFFLSMNPEQADIYLINTCAFIPSARSEAVEAIEEAQRWKEEAPDERKIVITGCLIQWDKQETYRKQFPAVDLWTGVDQVPDIAKYLKR